MSSSFLLPSSLLFNQDVFDELQKDLKRIKILDHHINDEEAQEELTKLIMWLRKTPKNIVIRVNTLLYNQSDAYNCIIKTIKQNSRPLPTISTYKGFEELIIINSYNDCTKLDLNKLPNEIIVDSVCGAAVLRGAHIYAPGVLGMPRGLNIGDRVSVYVDLKKNCKKGYVLQLDDENKLFIGNGIMKLSRDQLFTHTTENINGIAVLMTDIISNIPQLNEDILPKGCILLQNLPSMICSRVLDPQPGETILDMCAAPGNKTTHIAALMENKGIVIALEKNKNKLQKLLVNLDNFSAQNVKAFCFDSTKAVCEDSNKSVLDGPPFSVKSFDRILLDGPCSALGQRPQINNSIKVSHLHSYIPLQRKLFSAAVQLLKPGGTLVYSTCTITIAENEGIVAWALKTFPMLQLQSIKNKLIDLQMDQFAEPGYNIDELSVEQSNDLCRFGVKSDFVGFFIARFIKR